MTWEEKLAALQALSDTSLRMRKPGDWYVNAHAEVVQGSFLVGEYGNGTTPEDAVTKHWDIYSKQDAVVKSRNKYYTWTGFMWREVERP